MAAAVAAALFRFEALRRPWESGFRGKDEPHDFVGCFGKGRREEGRQHWGTTLPGDTHFFPFLWEIPQTGLQTEPYLEPSPVENDFL